MATVTGYTAERMQDIEDGTVVDGNIVGDNLILVRHDGGQIDAGSVRGPQGIQGPAGPAAVLPGIISMFGGNTAPAGYLICNGAAVSRTTYAALYAQIGVLHGPGDGTTTFNLPDMQARFPIGKGAATYADVVGEKGGSKDTVAVQHDHAIDHAHSVPNHQHGMTHTHTVNVSSHTSPTDAAGAQSLNHLGKSSVVGVDGTDKNLPPFVVVNYIIKT